MPERKMAKAVTFSMVATGALAWLSVAILGEYGYVLFLGAPLLLGFSSAAFLAIDGPEPLRVCITTGGISGSVVCLGFLIMGAEGLICIGVALPLAVPMAMLGGLIAFELFHQRRLRHAEASVIIVATLLAFSAVVEARVGHPAPVYLVEDSMLIHATPDRLWRTVTALDTITSRGGLLFRAGIACPRKTKIVDGRVGGRRVCTLTTGVLMEEIDVWRPGQRLAWRAVSTPPPMKELNPFAEVDAPHLHGFYRNVRGEFVIEPVSRGVSRLTRRTWYAHDLYPSAYWRIWCDMGASNIQRFVLDEVKRAAEHA